MAIDAHSGGSWMARKKKELADKREKDGFGRGKGKAEREEKDEKDGLGRERERGGTEKLNGKRKEKLNGWKRRKRRRFKQRNLEESRNNADKWIEGKATNKIQIQ